MSVRGKALRFAIPFGVMFLFSACALNKSSLSGSEHDELLTGENTAGAETVVEARVDEPAADVPALAAVKPELVVTGSEQLIAKDDAPIGVEIERGAGFSTVVLQIAGDSPDYEMLTLEDPSRLVLDIVGYTDSINRELPVGDDSFIESVRIGMHEDRTRVVLDLSPDWQDFSTFTHDVAQEDGSLRLTLVADGIQAGLGGGVIPDTVTRSLAGEEVAAVESPASVTDSTAPALDEFVEEENGSEQAIVLDAPPVEAAAELTPPTTVKPLTIQSVEFTKTHKSSGEVTIDLSQSAAFRLERSAPTEFVIILPGAIVASGATAPHIAPKSFPGMRSVRAVQGTEEAKVRMFVDVGVELQAFPRGNSIVVEARDISARQTEDHSALPADSPEARAQLEYGDLPEGSTAKASDDSTARTNPTGIRSADGSKIYTGRLISLDLQDTDIDNALRIIAEVSNLNIIASDDVSGKVTLRLIDVPWDQALDVILKTNGLDQVTEGNVIRIAPVDKLRREREALREAKVAAENLEDLTVDYLRISYARVEEMVPQIESVLSERGTVTTDSRTNQLIVKDIKKGHDRALELIKRLDLRTPQVLLETQIVEGQRNVLRDLGFQWNYTYIRSPETGNATGYNFPNSVAVGGSAGTGNEMVNFPAAITDLAGSAITAVLESADGSKTLSMRITALETEGKVKVISRPQVATVNNKEAEIRSVETVRVRLPDSGTSIATGSGASASGGGSTAFEEIDVGIELTVTPQASPDYYVLLDVNATSSTFGSNQVDNIPSTLEREATSTILVKSGQTFALGGVYRIEDTDQVQGVPFLKDIPVLGVFFRRSLIDKSDEELIFFITPHIVEGSFDPSLM